MEETPLEAIPTSAPKRKINTRFVYLIFGIITVLFIFFGFRILGSQNKQNIKKEPAIVTPTQTPSPAETSSPSLTSSPTPSPTNTPTPKPTVNPVDKQTGLDRSELSVTVQNGSGEAGVAAKGADMLKNLGYKIAATGNADNFSYTNVTIEVKPSKTDYLALLKKDLGFTYIVGSVSADLSDSFSSDALVIIGK